jgi:hypothetical protein
MRVPEGGQQRPLTRNGAPIVSCLPRRGDCLRGVLPRMNRIMIENGIGIGHGFGMFAPFWDGAFFGGRLSPGSLAPSARRSPGAIQGLAPSGPLRVQLPLGSAIQGTAPPGPIVRGAAIQGLAPPGPLGVPLSAGPLSARLSGALPDMTKGLLLPHRGGFANLRCALRGLHKALASMDHFFSPGITQKTCERYPLVAN